MKVKLLIKLRREGYNKVHINSITTCGSVSCGMSYSYSGDDYSGLYNFGDTESDVKVKAMHIYMRTNMEYFRKKYRKYSRKNKK